MPPKKTPASAKQANVDPLKLKVDELNAELQLLQRELALQTDNAHKFKEALQQERIRNQELVGLLESKERDHRDMLENLTRQTNLTEKTYKFESESLNKHLEHMQNDFRQLQLQTGEENTRMAKTIEEKNVQLTDMNLKHKYLASEFESLLHDSLNKFTRSLEAASNEWQQNELSSQKAKEVQRKKLDDFFLTRLSSDC